MTLLRRKTFCETTNFNKKHDTTLQVQIPMQNALVSLQLDPLQWYNAAQQLKRHKRNRVNNGAESW